MPTLKLTAAQKRLLTVSELARLKQAYKNHSDVAQVIQDLRAIRAFRQKQRDNLGKQVRAVKVGEKRPTHQLALNDRSHQKEVIFDEAVSFLEQRLAALRDQAGAECTTQGSPKSVDPLVHAKGLLKRCLTVVEQDAKSLREGHQVKGKATASPAVAKEQERLDELVEDLQTFLKKKSR